MKKLSKRQMAVAIAKDVIKQLNAKQFIAEHMIYVSGDGLRDLLGKNIGHELQDVLVENKPKCHVCAIGAAFLSAVLLDDKFKITSTVLYDWDMRSRLADYFDMTELDDMELAFEGDTEAKYPNLHALWDDRENPEKLLTFIMKQVIAQKGHFDIRKANKAAAKL